MPDYFAHEVYGNRVLGRLEQPLRARIGREQTAFWLGLYGPDPLFFLPGRARDEARAMHRGPGAVPIAPLVRAVRGGTPQATGYLAGFLCHFLLDSQCHPYVLAQAAASELNHTAIETEFDRYLLSARGFRTDRETPMVHERVPREVCAAAAAAYALVTPGHFGRAYRMFYLATRALTLFQGTPVRSVVNTASRVPGLGPLRGCVSGRRPDPAAEQSNLALEALLLDAVGPGAARIAAFFDALDCGQDPLEEGDCWQLDFFGRKKPDG